MPRGQAERDMGSSERITRVDRLHARLSLLGRGAGGFAKVPPPDAVGAVTRGDQIVGGQFLFRGYLIEAVDTPLWDLPLPRDPGFEAELHAMAWLDDLAAQGTPRAQVLARDWVHDWSRRFGTGTGPGWRPDLTGRRMMRWILHGQMLTEGIDEAERARFFRVMGRQGKFLRRRVRGMVAGRARLQARLGLLLGRAYLERFSGSLARMAAVIGAEARTLVAGDGTIASRNPEELATIFDLLVRASEVLHSVGASQEPEIDAAVARIAPVLRALRHADGGLPRFHGGGRGLPGRLDVALARSGLRAAAPADRAMGFARLGHARTTLIMDAAAPPEGALSGEAHASTLAFELTSGRRPVVVSCGSGGTFGSKWRRAGRATPSHSTLSLDGYSSARLGSEDDGQLSDGPCDVRIESRRSDRSTGLIAGHDGYVATHGLTHVRQVHLDVDGRSLRGEDVLACVERSDEDIFDRAMEAVGQAGFPFRVRFHLHPDIVVEPGDDPQTMLLMTRGGELWTFRHTGRAALAVEPSVYLDSVSIAPRATGQIVLSSTAVDYATRVSWTLAKARQTPDAVRDTVHDDLPVLA